LGCLLFIPIFTNVSIINTLQMNVLAIDPGKTNLGVWYGRVDTSNGKVVPETFLLEKIDMGPKVSLYQGAVQTAERIMAMCGSSVPTIAVVETQAPRNMPARVVACTIYGFLKGRNIDCEFSSSRLKNDAMAILAEQYGVSLEEKPTTADQPDAKARKRTMHTINKRNSKAVVFKMLETLEQTKLASRIASVRDPQGRKKADDMTDAILLGIGLCLSKEKSKHKRKKPARRCKTTKETPSS
jgi:hypothetical protein